MPKYHEMSIDEALDLRFEKGVEAYRGGDASKPFVGNAAEEAYEELLDVIIYAREMLNQGVSESDVRSIVFPAASLAFSLKLIISCYYGSKEDKE